MLDYANEPWQKLYERDTATWLSLRWQTRGLILEITRKADRDGVVHLGKQGLAGVALVLRCMDFAEMEPFLAEAIEAGKLIWDETTGKLLVEGHRERQKARTSDAQRQRMSRERREAEITREPDAVTSVTPVTSVTACHEERRSEERRSDEKRSDDTGNREERGSAPPPSSAVTPSRQQTLSQAGVKGGGGEGEKGPHRCPADLALTDEARQIARDAGIPNDEVPAVFKKFVDYFSLGAGSGKRATDWIRGEWPRWCSNERPKVAKAAGTGRPLQSVPPGDEPAWTVGRSGAR